MTQDGRNGGVYLVSAARTPIGKFGGAMSGVPAVELGGVAIRAAIERSGLPADTPVDEVIMGQVIQAGAGQAPARQAALLGGLPVTTSATTINKVCGSGLKAIMFGAAQIKAGDADVIVAGGMESMNGGPYMLPACPFRVSPGRRDDRRLDRARRAVVRHRGLPRRARTPSGRPSPGRSAARTRTRSRCAVT